VTDFEKTNVARRAVPGFLILVDNSQFDRRESGKSPELPFTVSSIEISYSNLH
jgi:hypothetical protein